MPSLTEPVFTGSTPNQKAIIGGHASAYPQAPAVPAGTIVSEALPPPGAGNAVMAAAPPSQGAQPAPVRPSPQTFAARGMPQPLGPLASRPAMPQQPSGAQKPAGAAYVVQPGDSLWSIAKAHGVTTSELLAVNGLRTATLTPGQRLAIPSSAGRTQVARLDAGNPQMTDAATGLPERRPAAAAAPQAHQQPAAPVQAPVQAPAAAEPVTAYAPANQPDAPAAAASTADGNTAGGFRWPVRGRIIAGFGKRPDGERSDGIKLSVPEGTSVRAAEDGTVIYAGDELKSYGNLILIRHADGWVSAYAHNKELMVRRGDEVRRGQVVAKSGMTGNVTTPQVHFELRKGATPVDPVPHMTDA
ncbi:MAG TPA: peptidoglycan DD-metalloendopeptidase family protein [Afifellaceae bacterium]|nr:peptidoglycan DD-metalloendopeptidase family protein [Afifellaceae bacterium]